MEKNALVQLKFTCLKIDIFPEEEGYSFEAAH